MLETAISHFVSLMQMFCQNFALQARYFYEEKDIMLYCNNVTLNVFFNVRGNKTLQQKVAIKL